MSRNEDHYNENSLKMEIDRLIEAMKSTDEKDSEKYAQMTARLDTLYKLREVDAKVNTPKHVSADTWAIIGANLAGIILVVGHERAAVITSKALPLVRKLF
jgi:hypothetical protein